MNTAKSAVFAASPAGAGASLAPSLTHWIRSGLLFGLIAWYLGAVGLLGLFGARAVVVDKLSLASAVLAMLGFGAGLFATRGQNGLSHGFGQAAAGGVMAGAIFGLLAAALAVTTAFAPVRWMFIALSPALIKTLTFGLPLWSGCVVLIAVGAGTGFLGGIFRRVPASVRRMLIAAFSAVMVAGVFQELLQIVLRSSPLFDWLADLLYNWDGLTVQGALIVLLAGVALSFVQPLLRKRMFGGARKDMTRSSGRLIGAAALFLLLMVMPLIGGAYIGQVMVLVGLYILMGMGLNLEVGLAGLLDLGFVAFFAVGAYATALLTGDNSYAIASLSFWTAMPIAVGCSVLVGVLFGMPVLGVRGDYLAVATLGLGEIVRVIVISDFAAPVLAGAQGLLQVPPPSFFGIPLKGPIQIFYLTLAASIVAAYVAWRLENGRLGRAWTALRDDEDVAQALGINLVRSKLLAYGLGAAFAGLAGSIFAAMLGSVYPSSFKVDISINVLALILVGGMGSLPGVIVGAMALIGLPEMLREFGEYRYLFYGAALVLMTCLRPEGLWPSAVRRRELHSPDDAFVPAKE